MRFFEIVIVGFFRENLGSLRTLGGIGLPSGEESSPFKIGKPSFELIESLTS